MSSYRYLEELEKKTAKLLEEDIEKIVDTDLVRTYKIELVELLNEIYPYRETMTRWIENNTQMIEREGADPDRVITIILTTPLTITTIDRATVGSCWILMGEKLDSTYEIRTAKTAIEDRKALTIALAPTLFMARRDLRTILYILHTSLATAWCRKLGLGTPTVEDIQTATNILTIYSTLMAVSKIAYEQAAEELTRIIEANEKEIIKLTLHDDIHNLLDIAKYLETRHRLTRTNLEPDYRTAREKAKKLIDTVITRLTNKVIKDTTAKRITKILATP